MLWRATVQRESSAQPKGFTPQSQQSQVGDAIFWFNEDKHTTHQPYPTSGSPGDWGEPVTAQNSSQQLNLDTAGTFPYECAFHDDETGSILVATAIMIGPTGTGAATVAPNSVTIPQGQSVSWGNSDAQAHQPMPVGGSTTTWFAAPIASGDISAPVTLGTTGSYPYQCALHPDKASEKGTITVTAAS